MIKFSRWGVLAHRPTPKLKDHPLSAVRTAYLTYSLLPTIFSGRSSIRNSRTCHAVITVIHLSRGETRRRAMPWLQRPTYHGEQPEDAPCRGYRDPLITGNNLRTHRAVVTETHLSRGTVFIKERTHFWLSRGQMYRDLQGVELFRCRGEACQCSDRKYFYVVMSMYETDGQRGDPQYSYPSYSARARA